MKPHKTNKNGERLVKVAKEENLSILNENEKTKGAWTWMRRNQRSIIDYFLISKEKEKEIQETIIDDRGTILLTDHDHMWMETTIRMEKEQSQKEGKNQERWDINAKTDWGKYRKEMDTEIKKYYADISEDDQENIEIKVKYDKILNIIKNVGEKTIGMISKNKFKIQNRTPKRVRNKIKKRNKAIKMWKAECREGKGEKEWRKMRKKIKNARKAIKKDEQIKKEKWIKKNRCNSKKIWTDLNNKGAQNQIEVAWTENQESTNIEDIKKYVEKYWTEMGEDKEQEEDRNKSQEDLDKIITVKISEEEYYKAKMELKNGKSVGWDEIPNEFLKYGGRMLDKALREIMDKITDEEYIPKSWKEDKLIMIYKKGDKNKCENYRGLSISSNISKLYSRIIQKRVAEYAEEKNLLAEMQNAFRRNRSTMDNLLILQAILNKAKAEDSEMYLGFIDLTKAYDQVPRQRLWNKMEEQGFGGKFMRIIKEMYREQKRKVKIKNGWSKWIKTNKGLRQGCVFSPLLFTIYINEIQEELMKKGGMEIDGTKIPGLVFADDIVIIANTEKTAKDMIKTINKEIRRRKLQINESKSNIIKISRKKGEEAAWVIRDDKGRIQGIIEETQETKYLGVTISGEGIYENHKKMKIKQINKQIGIMKWKTNQTRNREWATDEMWKQCTRANLLYAMEVIPSDKTFEKAVTQAQMKAARWAIGCSRKSSADLTRAEMRWKTIPQIIRSKKLIYWAKTQQMDKKRWVKKAVNWATKNPNKSRWMQEVNEGLRQLKLNENGEQTEDKVKRMRRELKKKEREEWKTIIELEAEKHYPSIKWEKRPRYMEKTSKKERRGIMKLRLRDVEEYEEKRNKKCPRCGEEKGNITKHIIMDCTDNEEIRTKTGIKLRIQEEKKKGNTEMEIVRNILEDTRKENLKAMKEITVEWERKKKKEN